MFPDERLFSFISMAYPGDTFDVVSFVVDEGLNRFFRMELLLCSRERAISFEEIIESPASCILHSPEGDVPVQGFISQFEQLHQSHGLVFYRAVLSPRLWWMTLGTHCQVFLDMSVPQILEQVLHQGGMGVPRYRFRLMHDYPVRELVCQYNESHYHFFLRWLEREGMYYYFQRVDGNVELVITDTFIAHPDVVRHKKVRYVPPSELREGQDAQTVSSLSCRRMPIPGSVQYKDRHYQTPTLDLSAEESLHDAGFGANYEYGGNILTPAEGRRLAKVRSEAIQAHATLFHGESSLHSMRAGFVFSLENHYREDFNQDYVVVACRHTGNQAAYLEAGLRSELEGHVEEGPLYANSFTALPAGIQYRPLRTVHKPRIYGTLSATVDAEGSGQYAELDSQGRYKVILPFDLSGRKDGKASCPIRMMQPYGGADHGLHCPLHKGTEVLLSFEGGDPDRPVIAGAVPNPATPSLVRDTDQSMCKLTTAGQNKLHFEDKEGAQRITLSSPTADTWMRLGAGDDNGDNGGDHGGDNGGGNTGDDDSGWTSNPDTGGFRINSSGNYYGIIGENLTLKVGGNSTTVVVGGTESFYNGYYLFSIIGLSRNLFVGNSTSTSLGSNLSCFLGGKFTVNVGKSLEIDAVRNTKVRPECFKTAEEKLSLVEMNTQLNTMKSEVSETKSTLAEQMDSLAMARRSISESQTAITETKDSVAETETKLRQDINKVLSEQLCLGDSIMALIASKMDIGDDELQMFTDSIEITEKTFL